MIIWGKKNTLLDLWTRGSQSSLSRSTQLAFIYRRRWFNLNIFPLTLLFLPFFSLKLNLDLWHGARGYLLKSMSHRLEETGNLGAKVPISVLLSTLKTTLKKLAILLDSLYFATPLLKKVMFNSFSDFKILHIHDKKLENTE